MRGLAIRFLLPFSLLVALFAVFVVYRTCQDQRAHARELLSQQGCLGAPVQSGHS